MKPFILLAEIKGIALTLQASNKAGVRGEGVILNV
jgi:hypothetical protein